MRPGVVLAGGFAIGEAGYAEVVLMAKRTGTAYANLPVALI
jgi:hypothetical protein